jgi:hypothetical protein
LACTYWPAALPHCRTACFAIDSPNIQFFQRHGVSGVFEEGDDASAGGDMNALKNFVMARMLWCEKRHSVFEFSLCLSRVCLGKMMHYIHKLLKHMAFFAGIQRWILIS